MNIFIWALVIFIFLLDQLTKFLVLQNLNSSESIALVKNIFHLTLVYNTGLAFGVFRNQTLFFTAISIVAVVAIFLYIKRKPATFFLRDVGFALILGGALGNLLDRLRFGYVIDFLDFRVWPVFNVADSAITVGAILLVISLFRRGQVSLQKD